MNPFSPNQPTGLIWSISRNIHLCVCLCVSPLLCDFLLMLKLKRFRCGMSLFININQLWRDIPPLSIKDLSTGKADLPF